MAVAARAARAYKRERQQQASKMYSTKASLPDLTFLKDYADEKPRQQQLQQQQQSQSKVTIECQMKTSASAAAAIGHAKQVTKGGKQQQVMPQTPVPHAAAARAW